MLDGGEPERDEEGNVKLKPPRKRQFDPDTGEEVFESVDVTMVQLQNKFADLDPTHPASGVRGAAGVPRGVDAR